MDRPCAQRARRRDHRRAIEIGGHAVARQDMRGGHRGQVRRLPLIGGANAQRHSPGFGNGAGDAQRDFASIGNKNAVHGAQKSADFRGWQAACNKTAMP